MGQSAAPGTEELQKLDGVDANEIRAQLDRMLASAIFRGSKRAQRFLRYVTTQVLLGRGEFIKERTLGIEVFDRSPSYDLNADPIVRVLAGDIRKRIAQYYIEEEHKRELRIVLLPGSYVPHFLWPTDDPHPLATETLEEISVPTELMPAFVEEEIHSAPAPPTTLPPIVQQPKKHSLRSLTVSVIACLSLTAVVAYQLLAPASIEDFWKPLLGNAPITLSIPNRITSQPNHGADAGETVAEFLQTNNRIGPNDVVALARVAGYLGSTRHQFIVFFSNTTTLTDLRAQPSVLIGGLNNNWIQRLNDTGRYRLTCDAQAITCGIADSTTGKVDWQTDKSAPIDNFTRDYAVIVRKTSHLTGQPTLMLAGLGPYGTAAATDFIVNPAYFQDFLKKAPRGWNHHEVQIVVRTDVVNGRPGPPEMIGFDIR